MEHFLNYVRDSDPATVNSAIGNAYGSSSEISYDPNNDDLLKLPPVSPRKVEGLGERSQSAGNKPVAAKAEPITPVA